MKEGSSAFTEVAKKQDKPPLFGHKLGGVIIERGTMSKHLKAEAKRQLRLS